MAERNDMQLPPNTPAQPQSGFAMGTLVSYVLRQLGPGGRLVELNAADIQDSIEDALDLFAQYVGARIDFRIPIAGDLPTRHPINEMELPEGVMADDLISIVNCQEVRINTFESNDQLGNGTPSTWGYQNSLYLGESEIIKHHQAMRRDLTNNGFEWNWDAPSRVLYFDNLKHGTMIGISAIKVYKLYEIPRHYQRRFKEAVEGYARVRLGDARGKFDGQIPGSTQGQTVDSQHQREKGQQLIETVTLWLENAMQLSPPIVG